MIPEDIQKEWDDHLYGWHITLGMPNFLDKAAYNLLELSSVFSNYALYIASEQYPPVGGGGGVRASSEHKNWSRF